MPGYLDSNSGLYFGWDEGEDGWGTPTNRSLRQLAYGGLTRSVKGTVSSPPSTPTLGDKYIVGANPTGWGLTPAPLEHQIVVYGRELATPTNISWLVFQPRVGNEVFDESRGIRVQYYEGSWQEIRPSQNQPILSDNTISGDGVTTPQSVQFPDQLQSDWSVTDTASASYIRNKPTIPRAIVPTFWQSGSININGNVNGSASFTLGTVRLDYQTQIAAELGRMATDAGARYFLQIGIGANLSIRGLKTTSRLWLTGGSGGGIHNSTNGRGDGVSYTDRLSGFSGTNTFALTLRASSRASDNFSVTGSWYAGPMVNR